MWNLIHRIQAKIRLSGDLTVSAEALISMSVK
jgi:hypothetical protein